MKGAPIIEDKLVMTWDEFMAKAPRSTTPSSSSGSRRSSRAGWPP